MILKNEERHIARCLESAEGVFDEIIIVDTGSTDKTKEIVKKFTDKVFDFEWIDDFAAARNFSFEKATSDYIMWLDADDVLPEKTKIALTALKKISEKNVDVYRLPYQISFDELGNSLFTFRRERILKNCPLAKWVGAVHEVIVPFGVTKDLDVPVQHRKIGGGDSTRNLRIYEKLISDGKILGARDKFYYARELFYNAQYEEAIKIFTDFLENENGWLANNIDACVIRAQCFGKLNRKKEELLSLFEAFTYDTPGAETCCEIGKYFFLKKDYKQAIFWYQIALNQEADSSSGRFILEDCYGYIPAIQLCVCFWNLGEKRKAYEYNEKAGTYKLTKSVLDNRQLFQFENLHVL
jgi:glycosyltransferase involved in cell wall biosynthesis